MRFPIRLLLTVLVGVAHGASETAKVYIFPRPDSVSSSTAPVLSPEEARLVIAHRLGVSQYHSLDRASNDALSYVNAFGGKQIELFADQVYHNDSPHLVIVIDGVTQYVIQKSEKIVGRAKPDFEISNPPAKLATARLIGDLSLQIPSTATRSQCSIGEDVNPFLSHCWGSKEKILHQVLSYTEEGEDDALEIIAKIMSFASDEYVDVMIILVPRSNAHRSTNYGSYDMPSRQLHSRDAPEEEPIELPQETQPQTSNKAGPDHIFQSGRPVAFATCYGSKESCGNATNDCSGHGECELKFIEEKGEGEMTESCFACKCVASVNDTTRDGKVLQQVTYWGGSACSKQDVSGPFWLLAGFSIILMALVSAAIGMMFSVGDEKLPGVIGAGVSGPKAR